MHRCLQLARLGAGRVAPNPMVGAVLVHEDRILSEGFHERYGEAHAEVNCLNRVSDSDKELISRSTLYVSLEPCSHVGKTPPCADLIIARQIPRVVIGTADSYHEVDGRVSPGWKHAGIEVVVGVLKKNASARIKGSSLSTGKRPYVILKWAQSSDGLIASEQDARVHISHETTNRLVHQWRSEEASIMIGTRTAMKDDPELTNRLWSGKDPVRMVIDRDLSLPESLHIFDGRVRTLLFNEKKTREKNGVHYIRISEDGDQLKQIMTVLFDLDLQSVLVEGGSELLQSFIRAGLWDEARVITNTRMKIGKGISAPQLPRSVMREEPVLLEDQITIYHPVNNNSN
ncbi:MAG: bifunctional diaminohydroxyphosphoribosylaminopyrimidine deaminase/5-amino-6-(5-phosphoribosylamino)uracil reductase RibD [Chitinophagaceae bacterium]|nr:bifunctional diaminohydroxyphosphoribosylaminopyrimidine deaminase/5-amino-6-(5-phosphoribosylamino)uracil reductase RibD [Chitinophagaceae bacterium]